MEEYFPMGHVELVPTADLEKSQQEIFYLPVHAVKEDQFCFLFLFSMRLPNLQLGRFIK
jgi:hypothetical protein